jgi:adenosylcobinamide kinase/adenosylcobinamide-phosphate guanylyltransferase
MVECLTLWLTNLLCRGGAALEEEREALFAAIPALPGTLILVSKETGLGVHPVGELARRFCDEAGITHQRLVALCNRVTLTIAGLVLTLKDEGP